MAVVDIFNSVTFVISFFYMLCYVYFSYIIVSENDIPKWKLNWTSLLHTFPIVVYEHLLFYTVELIKTFNTQH